MASISINGTVPARSLVQEGSDFCEDLVRRGGRALTIPFGNRSLVVSFQWNPLRRRQDPGVSPELSDGELARLATQDTSYRPAWEQGLSLQYGGTRRV